MSNIWLDITTIKAWTRPPVGIVRVEFECCRYALKHGGQNIRFCWFDRSQSRYIELTRDDVTTILVPPAQTSLPPQVAMQAGASGTLRGTAASRVKLQLRRAISSLPTRYQEPALRRLGAIYRFARDVYVSSRNSYQAMKHELRQVKIAMAPLDPAPNVSSPISRLFSSEDVYVSMGLDWDQKDLDYLYGLKKQANFKVLLFCYDLIPVLYPHLCVGNVAPIFGRYFVSVAWCADKVLCISESSRRDLAAFWESVGAPHPDTAVVRLGSDIATSDGKIGLEVANAVSEDFILFVSTIERRKNHEVLYRAYTRLAHENINLPTLVFVGMQGWGVNDLMADLHLDPYVRGKIRILNHVSDAELAELFLKSRFTVYPSLYEGWGLPLAESLAYGKFCLTSNSSSLPEVAGDLVEYIDPWDTPAWTARLRWYIENPEAVKQYEASIRAKYHAPKWEETGRAVLEHAAALIDSVDHRGTAERAATL